MKIPLIILLMFYCGLNAQVDETMHFELDFKLNLSNRTCYEFQKKYTTDNFDLKFYLIYTWPLEGRIKEINKGEYKIEGQFTYLVGGPGANFYPTLVIMAEPKFLDTQKCENQIKTYFVNLEVLYSNERSTDFGYVLKEHIGNIKLSDKPFIMAKKNVDRVYYEYSSFFSDILSIGLESNIENWIRL